MQTGTVGGSSQSVIGIMRNSLAKEGIRGLYRGVSAPIVAVSPVYALSFWGYDAGQLVVKSFKKDKEAPLNLTGIAIAGGLSAFPATAIMAPTERIKCLLQVQSHANGKPQYSGMMDCAIQVYRTGGIRSLYKGTALTLMRDGPGSVAWFSVYELVKSEMMKIQGIDDSSKLSPLAVVVAGGFAGMACWVRGMSRLGRILGFRDYLILTIFLLLYYDSVRIGCIDPSRCVEVSVSNGSGRNI